MRYRDAASWIALGLIGLAICVARPALVVEGLKLVLRKR